MQQNARESPSPLLPQVAPLRQASRRLVRELGVLENRITRSGMTNSQAHALIELERQGIMTAGELSAVLNLDKSTTSRTVTALTRAGLVTTRTDAGDRRRRPLVLTRKGRRNLAELHQFANQQVQEALALLGDEERGLILRGMELYARALARRRGQQGFTIRPIAPRDDPSVARIIRATMFEYGGTGTELGAVDPELTAMSQAYSRPGHGYWVVATRRGRVVGGGGFAPLPGADPTVCELRRMYFLREARGVGMGAVLLARALDEARRAGYGSCYLETIKPMVQARRLYESFGFRRLEKPMGTTGHFWCDAWYLLDLTHAGDRFSH